jgi:alpha-D-ribose 1-methylphosphonate 5-triphosphate diphosphatase
MHTDNLERHFLPRPKVIWPNGLAAALAHDAQMAAAGVTTVYDAICVGTHDDPNKIYRRQIFGGMVEAVHDGVAGRHFRIDHRIHLRCELSSPSLMEDLETVAAEPLVLLASLMDHTPGQRQWRNIEHLRTFARHEDGKSDGEFERDVQRRLEQGPEAVRANWDQVLTVFRSRGIPIATHDDTTEEHVADAVASGARISEFPTTVEAARAAQAAGLATVAGAPNIVRGGSHSGGVAVTDLVAERLVDGLSSDYVPASLLQAVNRLGRDLGLSLHEAMSLVTWRVADMVGLSDRGRLRPGLRADFVRFRFAGDTPVVRELHVRGRRVL